MKTIKNIFIAAMLLCTTTTITVNAQTTPTANTDVPKTITYQGMVSNSDGTPIADGQYNITVTFYTDANGTNKVWQGTYPATVMKGVFNVVLGNGASPFTSTAMFNQQLWVGVKVNDGDEMRPLTQLSSAPSALGVADSSITASKMATNYIAGITVNGTPITGFGSTVNLVGAGNTSLLYDQQTNSIIVNATMSGNNSDTANKYGYSKGNGGANTESFGATVLQGASATGNMVTEWDNTNGVPYITNSDIYDNSGEVGIRTTTPGSTIEIKGSGTTNSTSALSVLDNSGNSHFFVRDDGNVGIGTNSPGQALTIAPASTHNVTSLLVKQTAASTPSHDVLDISNSSGSPNYVSVDKNFVMTVNNDFRIGNSSTSPTGKGHIIASAPTEDTIQIAGTYYGTVVDTMFGWVTDVAGTIYMNTAPDLPSEIGCGYIAIIPTQAAYPDSDVAVVVTGSDCASALLLPYGRYFAANEWYSGNPPMIVIGCASPANFLSHSQYRFQYHVMGIDCAMKTTP